MIKHLSLSITKFVVLKVGLDYYTTPIYYILYTYIFGFNPIFVHIILNISRYLFSIPNLFVFNSTQLQLQNSKLTM